MFWEGKEMHSCLLSVLFSLLKKDVSVDSIMVYTIHQKFEILRLLCFLRNVYFNSEWIH